MRLLLLCLLLLCSACSDKVPQSLNPKYLAAQNYSSLLATGKFVPIDTPSSKVQQQYRDALKSQQQSIGNAVPRRALTPTERKVAGLWIGPTETHAFLNDSFQQACFYYLKHGRLPRNSEEVLAEFLSGKTLKAFRENPQQTKPYLDDLLVTQVNVSSGKLHDSFEEKQWRPFAIDITVVNPVRHSFLERIEARLRGKPLDAYLADFQVTVYGENPGTTLYKATWHGAGHGLVGDPY